MLKTWIEDFKINVQTIDSNIGISPPYVYLDQLKSILFSNDIDSIQIGSQDVDHSDGARTGAISASMLLDLGCKYTIIGHSERRSLFKEDNKIIEEKFRCLESNNIMQVLCIGESLEEMESGKTLDVLNEQITSVLKNKTLNNALIAYEPIWAIGTGKTPTSIQVNQINECIKDVVQSTTANNYLPKVLYGGSVNSENAAAFFSYENIDGALVGGASLDGKHFAEIVNEFNGIK
jgi:triosephosphate isomerase|tara:strand:- start:182 stop:883 length:702 start_codon:yes stop_codon:yes gene_type:complete